MAEKDRFCHQLERVVRWLGEKADKQREKVLEAGGEKQKRRSGREETDGGKTAPPAQQK